MIRTEQYGRISERFGVSVGTAVGHPVEGSGDTAVVNDITNEAIQNDHYRSLRREVLRIERTGRGRTMKELTIYKKAFRNEYSTTRTEPATV